MLVFGVLSCCCCGLNKLEVGVFAELCVPNRFDFGESLGFGLANMLVLGVLPACG